ncbi:hypothetical protein B0H13DRAFT_2279694 [Mycena leptocephala]|nr:hypothetical protein B0H13DRAFT_2279694 [Mycena leptocephala]
MARQLTPTEIRLNNITAYLTLTITLLKEINHAFHTPFIQPIINTSLSLITKVQSAKRNKDECVGLMENVHRVLCAIVTSHVRSETAGSLSPSTLDHIGSFKETLHKIYTFIDAQQDGNKIKQFLRQSEMNVLLRNCRAGLDHAITAFDIETGVTIYNSISEMKKYTEKIHEELLELISTLSDSDGTFSDRSSSIYHEGNGSQNRSHQDSILGGGGMVCPYYVYNLPLIFPDTIEVQKGQPKQFPQPEEMNQLLQFTDNMPLAVDLMAHLVDYEGFSNVLARWETEKTSLLSADPYPTYWEYFHSILNLYQKYNGEQLAGIVTQITLNMGNCTKYYRAITCEVLIAKLMSLFQHFNDPILECKFLNAVAVHYNRYHSDPSQAMEFSKRHLRGKVNEEANEECTALAVLPRSSWKLELI